MVLVRPSASGRSRWDLSFWSSESAVEDRSLLSSFRIPKMESGLAVNRSSKGWLSAYLHPVKRA